MTTRRGFILSAWCLCSILLVVILDFTSPIETIPPAVAKNEFLLTNLTPAWQGVTSIGAPAARYWYTAIWTGSEMIIFGGIGGSFGYLNDGARYNPATDSWTPLPTDDAPSARTFHTAIWTGSEMIVWGGCCEGGSKNDGARYDLDSDSWTPISTTDTPSARYNHTAVWTGSEMIIWGGTVINDNVLADGARYNPTTDTWTPISTVDAPTARQIHSAVWTGNEMIVWGGVGSTSNEIMSGARYKPATDSWTPLPTDGAPYDSAYHTAFWTGSEMIVWGVGAGAYDSLLNDGARYDPVSDSWTLLSTSGVPSERADYAAVWTGAEMFVWGGAIGGTGGPFIWNDGARYNPITDSWTPLPTNAAPSARYHHTAIWTGSEMIVWGGRDDISALGDGARLRGYYHIYLPVIRKE